MKLLTRMLPFIKGIYVVTSTFFYCGMTFVFSMLIVLLAILSAQKNIEAGDPLSLDVILNAQPAVIKIALGLAVTAFILVLVFDIGYGNRSTHITGLKIIPLLIVRIIIASVFYAGIYFFSESRPEILYDGVMINFMEFLIAFYLTSYLNREIIKEFTGSYESFTLKSYLNALSKRTWVEIIGRGSSNGVYTAGELLEKEPGWLNCIINPNSISIGKSSASNCIAEDSKEHDNTIEILGDCEITYLAVEIDLPIRKARSEKEPKEIPVLEQIDYINEIFTLPVVPDITLFRNELVEKTMRFRVWIEHLLNKATYKDLYFFEWQRIAAENIYVVCMLAAFIENRSTDIKEYTECINNYGKLEKRVMVIEKHYGIYVSSDPEIADGVDNMFYPVLKYVKTELLGSKADHALKMTRALRNSMNKIAMDV